MSNIYVPFSMIHPTHAVIDLGALRHNIERVRGLTGNGVSIMAVVKADAYGHGMCTVAEAALGHGVEALGVARVDEGLELRAQHITAPILVFEIAAPGQQESAIRQDLDLTVSTVDNAVALDRLGQHLGRRVRIQIKVDTGMGRLGFDHRTAADAVERITLLKHLDIRGMYSHFATSEEADQTYARGQLKRFNAVLEELERRHIGIRMRHMANSGAILTLPESHFDMVRPGIMLYGYAPSRELSAPAKLQRVMSLFTRVSFVKKVPAGTSISYNRRFITANETHIATIPIGYGDGYARGLTNKAEVIIAKKRYPVVGTVCMDHCLVDCGPDGGVKEGDEVMILGGTDPLRIDAWDLASLLGTIPYEITCMITKRVPRTVVG